MSSVPANLSWDGPHPITPPRKCWHPDITVTAAKSPLLGGALSHFTLIRRPFSKHFHPIRKSFLQQLSEILKHLTWNLNKNPSCLLSLYIVEAFTFLSSEIKTGRPEVLAKGRQLGKAGNEQTTTAKHWPVY